jgi:hypothetical protein
MLRVSRQVRSACPLAESVGKWPYYMTSRPPKGFSRIDNGIFHIIQLSGIFTLKTQSQTLASPDSHELAFNQAKEMKRIKRGF